MLLIWLLKFVGVMCCIWFIVLFFFFFQAEDGIRDYKVTGVQTCDLYLGYLIARGYLEVTLMTLGLAFVVMLLYGDQFWTMLPDSDDTTLSWEGHMFGFLGGVLAASNPDFLQQIGDFLATL